MLCRVKITETRVATVWVDVDYDFEAEQRAKDMYNKGIVTTDTEDVMDVTFELDDEVDDD